MARKKPKDSAFTEINQLIVADVSSEARWYGYQFLASDSPLNAAGYSSRYALARGAGLFDAATGLRLVLTSRQTR